MNLMERSKLQIFLLGYLFFLFFYWIFLQISGLQTSVWNYLYSFAFSLIPLFGGLLAMINAKYWGLFKSSLGRAIFFLGGGLFSWGVGSMIWSYYNFVEHISAPYPSLADVGFILSLPAWAIGMINLSKATGTKFAFKKLRGKLILFLLPILIVFFSYYLLVGIARDGVIFQAEENFTKLFFDLAYPLGDVVILSLALVIFGLSFHYFGGRYKGSVITVIVGLGLMYFADFVFSYTTTTGKFYNGNLGDLLFTAALFLMTYGCLGFHKFSSKNPTAPTL